MRIRRCEKRWKKRKKGINWKKGIEGLKTDQIRNRKERNQEKEEK